MGQHIAPVACKPWALNGLSERLIGSHYENTSGAAVASLNAVRDALNTLDLAAAALRKHGFDAKYVRGGLSAWYAAGGERALKPQCNA